MFIMSDFKKRQVKIKGSGCCGTSQTNGDVKAARSIFYMHSVGISSKISIHPFAKFIITNVLIPYGCDIQISKKTNKEILFFC